MNARRRRIFYTIFNPRDFISNFLFFFNGIRVQLRVRPTRIIPLERARAYVRDIKIYEYNRIVSGKKYNNIRRVMEKK